MCQNLINQVSLRLHNICLSMLNTASGFYVCVGAISNYSDYGVEIESKTYLPRLDYCDVESGESLRHRPRVTCPVCLPADVGWVSWKLPSSLVAESTQNVSSLSRLIFVCIIINGYR